MSSDPGTTRRGNEKVADDGCGLVNLGSNARCGLLHLGGTGTGGGPLVLGGTGLPSLTED